MEAGGSLVFTRGSHWSLLWETQIQSAPPILFIQNLLGYQKPVQAVVYLHSVTVYKFYCTKWFTLLDIVRHSVSNPSVCLVNKTLTCLSNGSRYLSIRSVKQKCIFVGKRAHYQRSRATSKYGVPKPRTAGLCYATTSHNLHSTPYNVHNN
jgi:hypothetical protein